MFGYGSIRIESQSWKHNYLLDAGINKVVDREDTCPWSYGAFIVSRLMF